MMNAKPLIVVYFFVDPVASQTLQQHRILTTNASIAETILLIWTLPQYLDNTIDQPKCRKTRDFSPCDDHERYDAVPLYLARDHIVEDALCICADNSTDPRRYQLQLEHPTARFCHETLEFDVWRRHERALHCEPCALHLWVSTFPCTISTKSTSIPAIIIWHKSGGGWNVVYQAHIFPEQRRTKECGTTKHDRNTVAGEL
jgi:hypothetical protein